ncbi:MAG: hypothetical protein Q3974_00665 [Rothia sp. (in: high G+C Gram-positive bacteria)]|nr:hypothetical protein [Rothia sp. (in: high G+C Gram-positive bacteria)]
MNTKDLSPAFITSLIAIFVAALMIGASSTVLTVLGWFILLVAVGLNVLASIVSIQRAKGGPLPQMVSGNRHRPLSGSAERTAHLEEYVEDEAEHDDVYMHEPEADTETQPVVSSVSASRGEEPQEEKIFRSRPPRPRNR